MMQRTITASFKTDAAAYARRQIILHQLEELLKRRAALDPLADMEVPRMPSGDEELTKDLLPRRGETVCTQCDCAMELQPMSAAVF